MLKKPSKIRSKKIKQSAKGEACTLRISGICNGNTETTVFAHLPGNKGTGTKNHDLFGIFACSDCHAWMDGRKKAAEAMGCRSMGAYMAMLRALQETQLKLYQKGLIQIP